MTSKSAAGLYLPPALRADCNPIVPGLASVPRPVYHSLVLKTGGFGGVFEVYGVGDAPKTGSAKTAPPASTPTKPEPARP